jgi:hypothetical protein
MADLLVVECKAIKETSPESAGFLFSPLSATFRAWIPPQGAARVSAAT